MATSTASSQPISLINNNNPKFASVKDLAETPNLSSIPSTYTHPRNLVEDAVLDPDADEPIPVVDFSLLFGTPQQRSSVVRQLAKACHDWGFFMVINHGIEEGVMKGMINGCREFFELGKEEKKEYEGKQVLDPIRCGTSFNASVESLFFWRDFLKVFVHPHFHSPTKPLSFSELSKEYCKRVREVARELLKAISESLGLEQWYIEKAMDLENGLQILIANLYPPCPQPHLAMGMPPHSDHGLLTMLSQNDICGLQLLHNGKWVNANPIPNSFLVNTGDHLEILSNGKYKSVVHRAVVNGNATRMSLAIAHGPSLESVVSPAPELTAGDNQQPAYTGMKYREYLRLQQSNQLDGKTILDRVRVQK